MAVIFLHIPRAAGTTVEDVLRRQYTGNKNVDIRPGLQHLREDEMTTTMMNVFVDESWVNPLEFGKLSSSLRGKIQIIAGHMNFGWHKVLPGQSVYFTILREPVQRTISTYYYAATDPSHGAHRIVVSEKMSLSRFMERGVQLLANNGQTRLLSGWGFGKGLGAPDVPYGSCPHEMLEDAKRNLVEHFVLFGVVDFFDEFLAMAKVLLGWQKTPFYVRRNASRKSLWPYRISKNDIEIAESYNSLDIELYRWAKKEFYSRIKAMESDIKRETMKIRAFSAFFSSVHGRIPQSLRKVLRPVFLRLPL